MQKTAAYGHMGRTTQTVEKTFTDGSGKSISLEVKLFSLGRVKLCRKK